MEPTTQADPGKTALEAQIRECFGRVVYSTKTHEKCADLCMGRLQRIKIAQIVLSAITTGGLLTAVLGDPKVAQVAMIVSTLFSTVLLVLTAYMKDVDPGQQAEKHKKTASELWDIRESYFSILSDLHDGNLDIAESRGKRDEIQSRLAAIYATAPRTNSKAYGVASDGLKAQEEMTFSDEEIDKFLPATLRRAVSTPQSTK
ncbi:MAG: hypothetical protein BroJett010_10740 [Gammaproteobacteria bacterium]|nr:MAG: hypothetical protein BroJett010_10740 [Gammaproteobacteria bacterium]